MWRLRVWSIWGLDLPRPSSEVPWRPAAGPPVVVCVVWVGVFGVGSVPPVADRFLEAPRADSRHGGSGGQPRLSSAASRLTTRPQARAEGGRPGPGGQAPKGPRRGLGWCFRSGFRAPVGVVRFSACSAGFCPGGSGGPGPSSGPGSGRPPSCFVFVGGWCVVGRRGVPFAAIWRVRASGGLGRPRPSVRPSVL